MNKILLTCILLGSALICKGQSQVNYWMGGANAMIKFDSQGAHFLYRPENNFFAEASASISDSIGNLLFYTNGYDVFNKDFQIMLNGAKLNIGDYGSAGATFLPDEDEVAIIPVPGNKNQYYLFHVDMNRVTIPNDTDENHPTHLFYSVIDMTLDNGNGGIVSDEKDIVLLNDTLSDNGIKIVKHGNGRDWWLLCHKAGSNRYDRLLIDPWGIHGPYYQNIGIVYDVYNTFSPCKFTVDATMFTYLTADSNIFELYDFDRCSGELSNYRQVKVNDTSGYLYGISFSPNNKYVYVTSTFNQILQFDITAPDIFSTRTVVGNNDGTPDPFYPMFQLQQLGPDGKMYVFDYNGCYSISQINFPDSAGLACDFVQGGFAIDSPYSWATSSPNIPNYALRALPGCDSLTGIVPLPNPEFTWSVYPNPFSNQLNISITDAQTDAKIAVYNLVGQKVYYSKQKQSDNFVNSNINLPSLSAGLYIVIVQVNGGQYERKVVKR